MPHLQGANPRALSERYVLGLDIGSKQAGSGYALIRTTAGPFYPVDGDNTELVEAGVMPNVDLLLRCHGSGQAPVFQLEHRAPGHLRHMSPPTLLEVDVAMEMIQSYGVRQGAEIFRTLIWMGRFLDRLCPENAHMINAATAAAHVAGKANAGDANVGAAVAARWGALSKREAVGTKKAPGPLHGKGLKADAWRAAAIAITYVEGGKSVSAYDLLTAPPKSRGKRARKR